MSFETDFPDISDMPGPVPQNPTTDDLVALDQAFTDVDYGINQDAGSTFTKNSDRAHVTRPLQKRAVRECRTEAELRELDRLLLKSVGL